MNIVSIKTDTIRTGQFDIDTFIDHCIPALGEDSVVIISAKVISLCSGATSTRMDKRELVEEEAQYYLDAVQSHYGQMLTIAHDTLLVSAGIDESNVDNGFVLLPDNIEAIALSVRDTLAKKNQLMRLGVLLVDSASRPLRRGTVGTCLASAGVREVKDYRQTKDLFDREIIYSQANHVEPIAAIAVALMGEGDERTPIVVATQVPFVEFTDQSVLASRISDMKDDLFAPLLESAPWKHGSKKI